MFFSIHFHTPGLNSVYFMKLLLMQFVCCFLAVKNNNCNHISRFRSYSLGRLLLFELVVSNNTLSCFVGINPRQYDPCAYAEGFMDVFGLWRMSTRGSHALTVQAAFAAFFICRQQHTFYFLHTSQCFIQILFMCSQLGFLLGSYLSQSKLISFSIPNLMSLSFLSFGDAPSLFPVQLLFQGLSYLSSVLVSSFSSSVVISQSILLPHWVFHEIRCVLLVLEFPHYFPEQLLSLSSLCDPYLFFF